MTCGRWSPHVQPAPDVSHGKRRCSTCEGDASRHDRQGRDEEPVRRQTDDRQKDGKGVLRMLQNLITVTRKVVRNTDTTASCAAGRSVGGARYSARQGVRSVNCQGHHGAPVHSSQTEQTDKRLAHSHPCPPGMFFFLPSPPRTFALWPKKNLQRSNSWSTDVARWGRRLGARGTSAGRRSGAQIFQRPRSPTRACWQRCTGQGHTSPTRRARAQRGGRRGDAVADPSRGGRPRARGARSAGRSRELSAGGGACEVAGHVSVHRYVLGNPRVFVQARLCERGQPAVQLVNGALPARFVKYATASLYAHRLTTYGTTPAQTEPIPVVLQRQL